MSKRILFIFTAVILAAAGIYYRASSAQSARTQAAAIVESDKAGRDTAKDLAALRTYVGSHMGSSVKVTLQGSYDRALAASQAAPVNSTSQVYQDAQKACAGRSDSVSQARCNEQYISSRLTAMTPAPTPPPAPVMAYYQHDLKAPIWTPDLAGALLLGAVLAAISAVVTRKQKR